MNQELFDFSEQIDEQFEITDIESDDFWEAIVNLFIWSVTIYTPSPFKDEWHFFA